MGLWQNFEDKKITSAMMEAQVPGTFKTALENLRKGGFMQAASWLSGIADAAFEPIQKAKPKKAAKSSSKAGSNAGSKAGSKAGSGSGSASHSVAPSVAPSSARSGSVR